MNKHDIKTLCLEVDSVTAEPMKVVTTKRYVDGLLDHDQIFHIGAIPDELWDKLVEHMAGEYEGNIVDWKDCFHADPDELPSELWDEVWHYIKPLETGENS